MSRTPLVLVHGNPESAAIWGPLIGELDRADAVVLSPPGFGVPAPRGFDSSTTTYRDWLASQLELFRAPVDLVGHDWGGIHVAALAMSRPDLIRSWASDALGVFAPDYALASAGTGVAAGGPRGSLGAGVVGRRSGAATRGDVGPRDDRAHGGAGRGRHGSRDGSRRPQAVAVGTTAGDGRSGTAPAERRTTSRGSLSSPLTTSGEPAGRWCSTSGQRGNRAQEWRIWRAWATGGRRRRRRRLLRL